MGIDAMMFVKVKDVKYTKDEIVDLAYRMSEAFGHGHFYRHEGEKGHFLEVIDEYMQDGDSIFPEKNEQFIRVLLMERYYGKDYERGCLELYINIAEWLEYNIPNGEVWYGGDSSGICAEKFDKKAREKLWEHFCECGHRPYYGYFDDRTKEIENVPSDFPICDLCKKPMRSAGWGHNSNLFECLGCGEQKLIYNDGKDHTEEKRKELCAVLGYDVEMVERDGFNEKYRIEIEGNGLFFNAFKDNSTGAYNFRMEGCGKYFSVKKFKIIMDMMKGVKI